MIPPNGYCGTGIVGASLWVGNSNFAARRRMQVPGRDISTDRVPTKCIYCKSTATKSTHGDRSSEPFTIPERNRDAIAECVEKIVFAIAIFIAYSKTFHL